MPDHSLLSEILMRVEPWRSGPVVLVEDAGPQPLVRDPYESRTVEVRPSSLGGGGDGLFVKRKIIKGEVVAFYNGIRLLPKFGRNENWDNSGYKIFTNTNEVCGERLDLPE